MVRLPSFLLADLTTIPRPDSPIERIASIGVIPGTECTLPFKEKRTAKCSFSMNTKAAEVLSGVNPNKDKTLEIALRIRYCTPLGRKKCFHGPVLEPFYDFDSGTISVDAIGPEDRMSTAYIVEGDDQITEGVYLDGTGFRELLAAAQNRPNQDDLNWPSLGIVAGYDKATSNDHSRKLSKGDEIWTQGFIDLGSLLEAPDWWIEDIDTDPTSVAIGTVNAATDVTIPANSVTTIPFAVGLPGLVGKMRVGLRLQVDDPYHTKIELIHPDGVTTAVLWNGVKVKAGTKPLPSGIEAFGSSDSDADLLFFADKGNLIYGTRLNPIDTWPLTGQYFTPQAPTATFFELDVSGTWNLKITTTNGASGTYKYGTLRFQLPEPAYARLNTLDPESSTDPVIKGKFYKGFGPSNAEVLNFRTMGSYTRNQAILATSDGSTEVSVDDESRNAIGVRQLYESSGQADDSTLLKAVADARVAERAWPPLTMELQPQIDTGQEALPRALYNYRAGNHIMGHAKSGKVIKRATARVDSITLKQATGGVETTLELSASIPE